MSTGFFYACNSEWHHQRQARFPLSTGQRDLTFLPFPNSAVKRSCADGSVGSPHVRVGHRQAPNYDKPQSSKEGWGFFVIRRFKNDGLLEHGIYKNMPKAFPYV
jgi:hypothetical protein